MHNSESYKMLYGRYSGALFGSIMLIVNDMAIAEDLLIKTFKKIDEGIPQQNQSHLSFLTRALQIARSESINYLCSLGQPVVNESLTENRAEPILIHGAVEPVTSAENKGTSVALTIFDMVLRGSKVDEIAKKMDMPVETVKINIRKGMKLKTSSIN